MYSTFFNISMAAIFIMLIVYYTFDAIFVEHFSIVNTEKFNRFKSWIQCFLGFTTKERK